MELTVQTTPAVIDANFDALEKALDKELEQYQFVVTVDTVKDAKKKAAEINKVKSTINARRKQAVDEASSPIEHFKDRCKALTTRCDEVRQQIIDQVDKFESETLNTAREQLLELRDFLYDRHQVREEFQSVDIEGQVKLGAITGKGKLTKSANDAVTAMVNECKLQQQRTDLRLSQLENECYRAGLHSPLTREHIAGFLFSPDDQYEKALHDVIDRELERQKATEEKLERQRQAELAPEPVPEPAPQDPPANSAPPTAEYEHRSAAQQNMVSVQVHCTLQIDVPASTTDGQITRSLRAKLGAAGIERSIQSITVGRASKAA